VELTWTRRTTRAAGVILSVLIANTVGCSDGDGLVDGIFTPAEVARLETLGPLPALAPDSTNRFADDPRAAALGQRLFFERAYSGPIVTRFVAPAIVVRLTYTLRSNRSSGTQMSSKP